jgi:hypothetical protein
VETVDAQDFYSSLAAVVRGGKVTLRNRGVGGGHRFGSVLVKFGFVCVCLCVGYEDGWTRLMVVEDVEMERSKDMADLEVFSDRQKVARWLVVRRKSSSWRKYWGRALGVLRDTLTHWSLNHSN